MKRVVLVLVIGLMGFAGYGQGVEFAKVIQTDSVGKALIYVNVKEWFMSSFNSGKDVIQMDDKEAGMIIGNGAMDYSYGGLAMSCLDGHISFSIKVEMKDNRIKVTLYNFVHSKSNYRAADYCELGLITTAAECPIAKGMNRGWQNKAWADMKVKIASFSNKIFSELEVKLKNIKGSKEGNW